ncbi:WD40 domain-containing protein [Encephalitozoon romaleae SJ-2008]|uniref:WD40 domain-containing protein n=1 Tax=Encephalitozoon romaleae (strain SJ-2008) TaxID=1178016 RepID=I7ANJ7_ENCRO|nr:WD40 domain-containing protein [Encephalitozoon romaleae SJ-2008]AFN83349.1 WD40 domain-containing protein [Encephalitozoon romaleae SJ-2008]
MNEEYEMSEKDYKKMRKSQPKRERILREDFGDPSEIGGFKGPWSRFVGAREDKKGPRDVKEEQSLRRIVNKHCLTVGKERSRSNYFLSMEDASLSRVPSKRFLVPKGNIMLFHDHKDMVSSVSLFRRHKLLLTSGLDGKAYLYNLRAGDLVTTYMGHSKGVSSATLSECESKFSTISFDGFLKVWDIETGRCNAKIDLECPLTCQSFKELGKAVFIGGLDGRIRTVDTRNRKALNGAKEESHPSRQTTFGPSSICDILLVEQDNFLVFTRKKGSLHYLDLRNDRIVKTHNGSCSFIGLNPEENTLMITASDEVILLDVSTLEEGGERIKALGCSTRVKASPDGSMLCFGDTNGLVNFIARSSTKETSLGSTSEALTTIDWIDGSSSSLVSGDVLGNIKVWE